MKKIPLTQGKFALVDDEDFEWLSQLNWCLRHHGRNYYAWGNPAWPRKGSLIMHRLITGAKKGEEVDHKNGNGLDNRKENLRVCSHAENMKNMKKRIDNKSGFKGVSWSKQKKKWRARIFCNTLEKTLGHFVEREDAARAYDKAAKKLHGEFAKLNFSK